jgi:hypothetical protein
MAAGTPVATCHQDGKQPIKSSMENRFPIGMGFSIVRQDAVGTVIAVNPMGLSLCLKEIADGLLG